MTVLSTGLHSNFSWHSPISMITGGSAQIFLVTGTCHIASSGGQKYHSSTRHSSGIASSFGISSTIMSSTIMSSSSTISVITPLLPESYSPPPISDSLQPANTIKIAKNSLFNFIFFTFIYLTYHGAEVAFIFPSTCWIPLAPFFIARSTIYIIYIPRAACSTRVVITIVGICIKRWLFIAHMFNSKNTASAVMHFAACGEH